MPIVQLLTPAEASEIYGIPEYELLSLANSRKIAHYDFGRIIRFDHDQISKYINPSYLTEEEEKELARAQEEKELAELERKRQLQAQEEIVSKREQKEREQEEHWSLEMAYDEAVYLFGHLRKGIYKDRLQELHDRICILSRSRKKIDKNELINLKGKYCILIAAKFNGIKKYKKFKSPLSKYYRKVQRINYQLMRTERMLADYEIITIEDWIDICERWGNKCLCCGKPGDYRTLTMDHVHPLVDGGAHKKSNIQPLCKSCNSSKGAKYIDYRR